MKKCSLNIHKENIAILFCQECKIYMCNECQKYHSKLFQNHYLFKLEKDLDTTEFFTGLCKEENHLIELKYFCKTHNILCCAECITQLKTKYIGKHSNCEICTINDIENEKKNKLKENIKYLEQMLINIEQTLNEIKIMKENINKNKEELKTNIQKIFTKLRTALNNREDKLLLEVDTKFNEIYYNEDIIKESKNLSNKIKISLEKGKEMDQNWNKNKLNSLINDCLYIENNIKDINKIKEIISKNNEIKFEQKEENNIFVLINEFGCLRAGNDENSINENKEQEEYIDEEGLEKEAIEMVMNEGKCSREVAIKALRAHNGDPVEALLEVGM